MTGPAASLLDALRKQAFWQMIGTCPVITQTILRTMAERVRNLESVGQENARLASLGTLAAGLAHELNNPAAAARRAAGQGRETYRSLRSLSLALNRSIMLEPDGGDALCRPRALTCRKSLSPPLTSIPNRGILESSPPSAVSAPAAGVFAAKPCLP